jgi:hypothetical protein
LFHKTRHRERKLEGALTVEAALVLPIFIYFMIGFIYIFQIISIHEHIQNAITEIGYETTRYAYVYQRIEEYKEDVGKEESLKDENKENNPGEVSEDSFSQNTDVIFTRGIGSAYYKMQLNNYLDEDFINNSCVKNGMNGITTYLSSFMEYDDTIDIIVRYKIKMPLGILNLDEFPMMQRVRLRGWNGWKVYTHSDEDKNLWEVYVALNGTVYHKSKNCTYINIKVEEIPFESISMTTNKSGEAYRECNICIKGKIVNSGHVYITSTGNKFHIELKCSSLKRTIRVISIHDVGSLRPCSRCYKE